MAVPQRKTPPSLKLARVRLRESDTMNSMVSDRRSTVRFGTPERAAKAINLIQCPAAETKTLAPKHAQDITNRMAPESDVRKSDNKSAKLFSSTSHPKNDTEVLSFQ